VSVFIDERDAHRELHFRTLLAQFGLTPKSKRGLAAREVVWNWSRFRGLFFYPHPRPL
jgi:hypothetical protein